MGAALPNSCSGLEDYEGLTCEPGTCDGRDPCDASQPRSFYDRYCLSTVLGKGSQGKVYLCTDSATCQEFAVKVMERSRRNAAESFKRELAIVKAAGPSRYVVQFLEHFVTRRYYFIVMEKYSQNLRKALKWVANSCGGPQELGAPALQNIIQQAYASVRHLHQASIVHRDVKSQNFLVNVQDVRKEHCRVVLTDFGLAAELSFGQTLSHPVGTRKYWPPEVYDGKYGHAMDIFALGVLVFLASTATFPYSSEEIVRMRDVFEEEGVVPDHLDPEARSFMRECLEKDPAKRPTAQSLASLPWLQRNEENIAAVPPDKMSQRLVCEDEMVIPDLGMKLVDAKGWNETVPDEGRQRRSHPISAPPTISPRDQYPLNSKTTAVTPLIPTVSGAVSRTMALKAPCNEPTGGGDLYSIDLEGEEEPSWYSRQVMQAAAKLAGKDSDTQDDDDDDDDEGEPEEEMSPSCGADTETDVSPPCMRGVYPRVMEKVTVNTDCSLPGMTKQRGAHPDRPQVDINIDPWCFGSKGNDLEAHHGYGGDASEWHYC